MNRDIDYVIAVAECKSISQAAELLYISQPSLSRYLTNLEKELEVPLFVRTINGTELTEAGRIYVEYAKEIKLLRSTMMSKIKLLKYSDKKTIRVGMTLNAASLTAFNIPGIVKERYPNSDIELFNIMSKDMETSLADGKFNFVVGPDLELSSRFTYDNIYKDPYVLVVHKSYQLEQFAVYRSGDLLPFIDIRSLPDMDYILQEETTSVRKGIDKICECLEYAIKPKMLVTNSLLAMQAVESGLGCCIVSLGHLAYINHMENLRFYQITNDNLTSTGILYLRNKKLSQEEKYCISCIKKALIEGEERILRRIKEVERLP